MKKGKLIFILAVITVTILVAKMIISRTDLENNGILSKAVVEEYSYVKYINNEESGQTVEFHRIVYRYEYQGNNFSAISELHSIDFELLFQFTPDRGDTINIIISTKNPKNTKIKKPQ